MKSVTMTTAALCVLCSMGLASAAQHSGTTANPNAKSQGSCVGVYSSQVRHNGQVVRQQAKSGMRAQEVQAARQADCQNPPKGKGKMMKSGKGIHPGSNGDEDGQVEDDNENDGADR